MMIIIISLLLYYHCCIDAILTTIANDSCAAPGRSARRADAWPAVLRYRYGVCVYVCIYVYMYIYIYIYIYISKFGGCKRQDSLS